MSVCHPSWRDHAACRGQNMLRLFYPGQGEPADEAKQVCAGCPVRTECLEYAMEQPELFGIWGGLSERQRRAIRVEEGRAPASCGTRSGYQRHYDNKEPACEECRVANVEYHRSRRAFRFNRRAPFARLVVDIDDLTYGRSREAHTVA